MLRPFLLVGVGGSGGKTLRVIRDDLQRRLHQAGWEGDLPRAWQFLHVDVPTVADGNDPDLPEQLPERQYQGLVGTGIDYRTIDQAMISTGGGHLKDALGGWRPDPNRVNIPASKGAGQFRALGRVITVGNLNRVYDALQTARRHLTGAEVIGELQRATTTLGGKPATIPHEPTVIVISSIGGGSGSGAVIDVCDAVRALGDKWANHSVGILYAPDVFDYLPEEARRGVRPNSLAAITELLSGYWNDEGASEGTNDLFARYGVQFTADKRLGPRYPFLVGARNEAVTYPTQNDIYRAMGRSIASWVASSALQDKITAYIEGQWAATNQAVPDRLPLHPQGTETPFSALGSARVGLGRDRFHDYAAEHLARTVVDRFLRRHEELRQPGDDRTEKQLIRDTADDVWGGFLTASGLHERGEENNQILDALQPPELLEDLKSVYSQILQAVKKAIPAKGARAVDVRRTIRNEVLARQSQFQTQQLACRVDAARGWVDIIQQKLATLASRSIAQHGAPVTVELLRRLITEVRAVNDELRTEAVQRRRWADDIDQQIRSALDDADTAVILESTDRLTEAVKRAVNTFVYEQEAEIRELAARLIPDLVANVLEPLETALTNAIESLQEEETGRGASRPSGLATWPVGDIVPIRLKPAPNEFLLESADEYPAILGSLVRRTVGVEQAAEARRQADIQVLLGTIEPESDTQSLIRLEQDWVPADHLLQRSVTAAPSRARYAVHAASAQIRDRAAEWLTRPGTAAGKYLSEGLRDYLSPDAVSPAVHADRLQRFESKLISALNAGAPLVSVNPSVLVQVHEKSEVAYSVSFSEVPLPDRSPGRGVFRKVLEARGQWNEGVEKSFSDGNGGFIDLFTMLREAYEPVVFDSLMRPIASEWGARSSADDSRSEFWRWRRARPITEALPMAQSTLSNMVKGWFTAGCLDQIRTSNGRVELFVPNDVGSGGQYASFPWPTLRAVRFDSADLLPAVLESVALAMLEVNTSESLEPMRPYRRLLALGSVDDHQLPDELLTWILEGRRTHASESSSGEWDVRQQAVAARLEAIMGAFQSQFAKEEEAPDVLGMSRAFELRHLILGALGDLHRAVTSLTPPSGNAVFF